MESITKVSAAFVRAQRKFAPALKTSTNPHFKSKYADLSACVEAVLEALNSEGIAITQISHDCDAGVAIETRFLHESGEGLSSGILRVPASKQDAQGYGSAFTYARRYSLMAACGIAPEDDDGNAAVATSKKAAATTPNNGLSEHERAKHLAAISGAVTTPHLRQVFEEAIGDAHLAGDKEAEHLFII
jgi:hypothetical protein